MKKEMVIDEQQEHCYLTAEEFEKLENKIQRGEKLNDNERHLYLAECLTTHKV